MEDLEESYAASTGKTDSDEETMGFVGVVVMSLSEKLPISEVIGNSLIEGLVKNRDVDGEDLRNFERRKGEVFPKSDMMEYPKTL